MNKEKNKKHIKKVLEDMGMDMTDSNYKETPRRVVEFLEKFTGSLRSDEYKKHFDCVFSSHNDRDNSYSGMLIQGPARIYSVCSHHLIPAVYDIFFGYIPQENRMIGFSKIIKIIRNIAKRPMNQEDFTQEIVDQFSDNLKPKGLGIIVYGCHFCMKMRGTKSNAFNITSVLSGEIRDNLEKKKAFLDIANNHKMKI